MEGGLNTLGMWKIKKELYPHHTFPPMAKKDTSGNLITTSGPLKNLYKDQDLENSIWHNS